MKVLYFAWLRERLNRGEEDLTPPETVKTVSDLMDWIAGNDEAAELAFADRKTIRAAIDEELVDHNATITRAKTVAFFPPMTGG